LITYSAEQTIKRLIIKKMPPFVTKNDTADYTVHRQSPNHFYTLIEIVNDY